MQKQKGGLSVGAIVGLVVLVLFVGLGISMVSVYASYSNLGNRSEENLIAAKDNAKNVLAQYGQKALEAAQVPEMYSAKLKEIVVGAIESRYGEGGSKAVTQVLTEANINLDPAMFVQIQQIIEGGRNDFQAAQQRQIDIRRQYKTELGTFFGGWMLKLAGYPKVNLADFDIISTDRADEAYKNKKESAPLQLFQK